ncbi:MAG TPA: SPOR domain-containing protein [Edaphobacter sp.]|nr:SPOR domain-containing protein [Edaphobacter sp.]
MYTRNKDLDDDDRESEGQEREISLGASFIVGIFFALVLICAIFFGFGYSLGRRSALPASGVAGTAAGSNVATPSVSTSKPASGIAETPDTSSDSSTNTSAVDEQTPAPTKQTPVVLQAKPPAKQPVVSKPSATSSGTQYVVQVAAVSRQGDANMLVNALKRRGYSAAVHPTPQDKLLHVQIGPFASKKDADAMRQRLIGDGYNAIVK